MLHCDSLWAFCIGGSARVGATRGLDGGEGWCDELIQMRVFGANDAPNVFSVIRQIAAYAQQAKDFVIAAEQVLIDSQSFWRAVGHHLKFAVKSCNRVQ